MFSMACNYAPLTLKIAGRHGGKRDIHTFMTSMYYNRFFASNYNLQFCIKGGHEDIRFYNYKKCVDQRLSDRRGDQINPSCC